MTASPLKYVRMGNLVQILPTPHDFNSLLIVVL